MGSVWIDNYGRPWCSVDGAKYVPPLTLHRAVRRMLNAMAEVGIPAVHTLCDPRIPRAEAWLRRLGFIVDAHIPQVYMVELGYHVPVWTRTLADVARS